MELFLLLPDLGSKNFSIQKNSIAAYFVKFDTPKNKLQSLDSFNLSLQYTRGVTAGKKSVRIPADLGRSVHTYLCG